MSNFRYEYSSDYWECGDGCCSEWNDIFSLFDEKDEHLGDFNTYEELVADVLSRLGATLKGNY